MNWKGIGLLWQLMLIAANVVILILSIYVEKVIQYAFLATYAFAWFGIVAQSQDPAWHKLAIAGLLQVLSLPFAWLPMFYLQKIPKEFPLFLVIVVAFMLVVCAALRLAKIGPIMFVTTIFAISVVALYSIRGEMISYIFAACMCFAILPLLSRFSFRRKVPI